MLIRNALRQKELEELEKRLAKETGQEIKEELDFCRQLQLAYDFVKNPGLWYNAFLGDDHIYDVAKIRKCWQENLDDEKKSQAASAYIWAMLNKRPPDQFSWSYLHFLCLGQDQRIWSYRQIEKALERVKFLRSDLKSSLQSWEKPSRYLTKRLVARLKDNTSIEEAQELADQALGILQMEPGLNFVSTIANVLTQRISLIRSFLDQYLVSLKEAMEKAQQACANYEEMSCQDAAEILLAMHREGRGLNFQTPKERTAYDHVLQEWHQDRQGVCTVVNGIFTTNSTEKQEEAWWLEVERSLAAKQISK